MNEDLTSKRRRNANVRAGWGERAETVAPHEYAARWSVWAVRGVGFKKFGCLLRELDQEMANLWGLRDVEFQRVLQQSGVRGKVAARLAEIRNEEPGRRLHRELSALPEGARLVAIGDGAYPVRALDLEDPPIFVYLWGQALAVQTSRAVAVVGSRRASARSTAWAHQFGRDVVESGVAVVSGGALGIDAAAHRGALSARGPTVAVLAGGLDCLSPRRHTALFEDVATSGAVITEYPLGVEPRGYHFARRNRIIAAMGDATVVVCAGGKSGTMLTAHAARELRRPLFVVPGALDDPLAEGSNELLVRGARALRDSRDFLLGAFDVAAEPQKQIELAHRSDMEEERDLTKDQPFPYEEQLSEEQRLVVEAMRQLQWSSGDAAVETDEIARHVGWSIGRLNTTMLELELGGVVEKIGGANAYLFRRP